MQHIYFYLWMISSLFFFCQCRSLESQPDEENPGDVCLVDEEENRRIRSENEKAWEQAQSIIFSDTDFLQTKQPMSEDAIAPYDYHTGLVGDKAYNQIVYIKALDRIKKHLIVENNELVIPLRSGESVYIAEDLFLFIVALIDDWNRWIKEGMFRIVKTKEGYYDIESNPSWKKN